MNPNKIQARAEMLIRKPVAEVFDAFINPDITSIFWFTKSSGHLEAGKQVQWDWEMYDVSIKVLVKAIEPNKRILIEWPGYGSPSTVEWTFTPYTQDATFVTIINAGFGGEIDDIVKNAMDSVAGFTMVLAGAKALLEHNIKLNLVADHAPAGFDKH
ncbi:MAG TPA: SRPBCC family protein [Anaerolineae bacterium]|jgi:uncharacterized protein YndB with AHSA1/START domain